MAERAGGSVYLVGAGPGDPGLLTVHAKELLGRADAVLYDRLIPPEALALTRPEAELYYVGKDGGGGPSVPQEETEKLMVRLAREGKEVVRLKGGDPLIFGRGGEEARGLVAAGISFQIVPGITAALAAGAQAGIPLTQRGLASGVAFITGHEDPAKGGSALDYEALSRFPGTLVLYMSVGRLEGVVEALIAAGRDPAEPAALVERAGTAKARVVRAPLGELPARGRKDGIKPPALAISGAVAGLSLVGRPAPKPPLAGLSVTVTRAAPQASALGGRLRALGAVVVEAPAIEIRPLPAAPLDPSPYALLCLTSPNGVGPFFERLEAASLDARALAGKTVCALGPGTARALRERGIAADLVPSRSVAEGLLEELDRRGLSAALKGKRALVARAKEARQTLPEELARRGVTVDVLPLYETVPRPLAPLLLERALGADYITFTAASTVRSFFAALRPPLTLNPTTRLVSIGPQTTAELERLGLTPHLEATRHDLEGLVGALLADAGEGRDR